MKVKEFWILQYSEEGKEFGADVFDKCPESTYCEYYHHVIDKKEYDKLSSKIKHLEEALALISRCQFHSLNETGKYASSILKHWKNE